MSSLSEIANAFPQTCKQNWVLRFPAENVKTMCSVVNLEHCVGRSFNREEEEEIPEYLRLHQLVVRRIGEMCRIVNQVKNSLSLSGLNPVHCAAYSGQKDPLSQIRNRCFPRFNLPWLSPQRLLLQDLHDSRVCHSLLVAESEEDIWKHESLYRPRTTNSDGTVINATAGWLTHTAVAICMPEQGSQPLWPEEARFF